MMMDSKEREMAALLKDVEDERWSQQTIARAGLVKLMEAVAKPKPPTEKLKELMRTHRDEKKK